jgi:broad specificity phosphatase PhoE
VTCSAEQKESARPPRVAVIHSCYRRARETAAEIIREMGSGVSEVRESILLSEQDFGIFEGTGFDKLTCHYPVEWARVKRAVDFKLR